MHTMKQSISENQHGFLPGKSIGTAIQELDRKTRKYKYYFEFDLEAFFNNVEVFAVNKAMRNKSIPEAFINYAT